MGRRLAVWAAEANVLLCVYAKAHLAEVLRKAEAPDRSLCLFIFSFLLCSFYCREPD
jgi:hypothetical protein